MTAPNNVYIAIGSIRRQLNIHRPLAASKKKMKQSLQLRKGIIKEAINKFEYLVEDVFDEEIINMTLSGKMKVVYPSLNIGDEVYVVISPFEPQRGRMANITTFKMDNELFGQKLELDKKYKDIK